MGYILLKFIRIPSETASCLTRSSCGPFAPLCFLVVCSVIIYKDHRWNCSLPLLDVAVDHLHQFLWCWFGPSTYQHNHSCWYKTSNRNTHLTSSTPISPMFAMFKLCRAYTNMLQASSNSLYLYPTNTTVMDSPWNIPTETYL